MHPDLAVETLRYAWDLVLAGHLTYTHYCLLRLDLEARTWHRR